MALCDMKCQVGKGRATTPSPATTWSWPCPSSISLRFQDVPSDADLWLCPSSTKETEAQRLI